MDVIFDHDDDNEEDKETGPDRAGPTDRQSIGPNGLLLYLEDRCMEPTNERSENFADNLSHRIRIRNNDDD